MYEKPSDPEDEGAGYGYTNAEAIAENDIYFYHSDHLGSTSYITDKDGNATQFVSYKPYGEALVDEHATSFESPWKFNGKELDSETGLYYYGARYYEPVLAMWYGIDALAEKYPSMGGYVYCAGNPVNLVDPDGNYIETLWDIANVVMDVQSFVTNVSDGNWGGAALDAGGFVLDVVAVFIPLPGGAGTVIKAGRAADKAIDAGKVVDKATDAGKALDKATDVGKTEKTYQTYTKTNPETGEVYSGRTSGNGTPEQNIAKRDKNHHMNKKCFGPAVRDKSSTNRDAIRGREQQLIDMHGGAKSQGGSSGNAINGISPSNPNADKYNNACKNEFGN